MAIISGLVSECPDMLHPKLSYTSWRSDGNRFKDQNAIQLVSARIPNRRIQHVDKEEFGTLYTPSVGRNHYQLSFDDGFPKEPFG
ncbi:unnamed protein product [Ilex paraguariensis]|uniref:Uncharacterized protein n=1 Tax=Ilex paraguariensis TaxID=185542 RepID=A0ABC8QSQ7_9AQUA